jgi:hypothetical protein
MAQQDKATAALRIPWSDSENQATVSAYFDLFRDIRLGRKAVKKPFYDALHAAMPQRSAKAFERKFMNVSFWLDQEGFQWIEGLPPAKGAQTSLREPTVRRALADGIPRIGGRAFGGDAPLPPSISPDELVPGVKYVEGAAATVTVNRYERDPKARKACLDKHGTACVVCGFSFEARYGPLGAGFIHVHHLTPLASAEGKEGEVHPVRDLRPVCPNCHAMLHRKGALLTPDELRRHLR